jgi:hypothetical protein
MSKKSDDAIILYKKGSQDIDLIVLLVNKTMPIISAKMFKELDYINYLIGTQIDKLKSMTPVYVQHLKNYNAIWSSQAILIGSSHQINYSRKLALKYLIKSPDKVTKQLTKMNAAFDSCLSNLDPIISGIEFFASLYTPPPVTDQKSKNPKKGGEEDQSPTPKPYEVHNLKDVIPILKTIIKRLKETTIPAMRKKSEELTTKKGGSDDADLGEFLDVETAETTETLSCGTCYDTLRDDAKKFATQGGVDLSPIYKSITIGSGEDECHLTAGYKIGERCEQTAIQLAKWTSSNPPDFKKVIFKYLWGHNSMFPREQKTISSDPLDTYTELKKLAQMSDQDYINVIASHLELDCISKRQLKEIEDSKRIENFTDYVAGHIKKYLDKDEVPAQIGGDDAIEEDF